MIQEVLFTAKNAVEVRECPDVAPGHGQVKVEAILSGISHGTEMNLLNGTTPGFERRWHPEDRVFSNGDPHKRFPVAPGYEWVGRIVDLGPGAEGVTAGDLVWLDRPHRSAHVVTAEEAQSGLLLPGMTPERGIFSALTRIALGAVHDAGIKLGDSVAVVGLGAIGLLAIQLARLSGALRVFALDSLPRRLEMAERLGAIPIDGVSADAALLLKRANGGGVDAALEVSGSYQGLQLAIACCGVRASAVMISSYQGAAGDLRLGEEFHRNAIRLISSMTVNGVPHSSSGWNSSRLNQTARQLLACGRLQVENLITQVFPVGAAPQAYDLIRNSPGECVRVALRY